MTYGGSTHHIPKFGGDIYYISASGNDSNAGTDPDTALLTIGAGIDKLSAGDALTIMAGTYTETGLDLDVNNCEMWFEIGAIIDPASGVALTISGDYCRVTCPGGALLVEPATNATGVLVSGSFCYLDEIRVSCFNTDEATSADIGFDITGNGADLRRCRVSSPDVAAFKVQGDSVKLEDCCTGGGAGAVAFSSIGYWVTNTCDKFRIKNCGSQGHGTAGFQVDTGCTNGVIIDFSSGGGDGKWTDADDNTIISDMYYDDKLYKGITLTATGGVGSAGTNYNLFKVTGAVVIHNILGHVTTIFANTSSLINLEIYSSNASVELTDASGAPDVQAAPVGAVYLRNSTSDDPLDSGVPSSTPAIIENANFRDPNLPIPILADVGATTYIQMQLSAALASGAIHWHCHWEPLTDDGFLEPA